MATPIILDCDPGHDDALAILLAAGNPLIDLLAITTVAGNQTVEKTTLNAQRVCTAAGINVPIAAGCDRPMNGKLRIAEDIHGKTGLDGPTFGPVTVPVIADHAVELMKDLVLTSDDPVTIVCTAPMTNLATMISRFPETVSRISEVIFMGGSTERGNTTPYGEFNIVVDPEAADLVFRSGIELTMCGLNLTHQALLPDWVTAELHEIDTELSRMCVELMTFFSATYRTVFGFAAPPVHDPVAVARVIQPDLIQIVDAPVSVELAGRFTRGATVVDLHRTTADPVNIHVGIQLNTTGFWKLMTDSIRALSHESAHRPEGTTN